ncbi:murein biosynthesis integral membrane protein MurJ [Priestia megaterium]|uniref:murein biosynthesis integral membrane protein MurJ n=1 Tax=Priestia megaterium TaxID=1404 RepID=UPI00101CCDA1|nr:lipid II flippase MurJ [Priestia megaterium]
MNIKDKESRNLLFVMIITICMQLFSLIRNSLAASFFGVSMEMDAYNISFNVATFLFSFLGTAVTTILIPNIARKEIFSNEVRSFITYLFLASIIISVLGFTFSKELLLLVSGNKDEEFIRLSSSLLAILLLGSIFTFALGVNSAIFQIRKRFIMLKVTQLISYVYIVIAMILVVKGNIYYYAFIITTATIINFLIQIYYLKKENISFTFNFAVKDKEFIIMVKNLFPVFFSTGLYQFSLMIDTSLASRLGNGQVSVLSYSNQVVAMFNTLILANIILFIYPKLAIQIKENLDQAKEKLADYIILVSFIMVLFVLAFIVAGKEGVSLLYERGAFSRNSTDIVYYATLIFIVVLPINGIRDLFYKFFYADNDTYTPFKNSVIISIINVILSVLFSHFMGLYGIILGTTLSSIISLSMITRRFKMKYKGIFSASLKKEILKLFFSFVCTLIVATVILQGLRYLSEILFLIIAVLIVSLIFIILLIIMKSRVFKIKL